MGKEDIIAIIKWGPLALFLLIFLFGMLIGLVRGRRKVSRRFIYVVVYMTMIFFFTPTLCNLIFEIQINGISVEGIISDFINKNETMNNIISSIPGLQEIINAYPRAIASLLLFVILVLVGLPLSFPVYIIYCIIYNAIYKKIFKYSKYERDANGKILRNEKKKKIKRKQNKHRLSASLLKGVEGVLVSSVIFVPIGVITRLYKDARDASEYKSLAKIEYVKGAEDIFTYLDTFDASFIGKIANSNISKGIAGYLSPVEIGDKKSTLEKELSNVAIAAIYIEESGIIKLLSNNIDILTLDLSIIKMDKLEKAVELLFDSATLSGVISDGVNYVLNSYLKDTLVEFSNDSNIMDKIKYNNSDEVKGEIFKVTNVIKTIIDSKLLELYQDNNDNIVTIVNEVKVSDVETILNKVLSIKILSECMPGVLTKVLKDYGLRSSLTKDDNGSFVSVLLDVIKLVQTLEIDNLDQLKEGNMLTNVVDILYKDGAIAEKTIDSLAQLLSNINSARVFDEVLVEQLNKVLNQYEINLNAKMLTNIKTKADWKDELVILENICELYDIYNKEEKVEFLIARELLENLKNTKAMILAFPIAYQKLFPQLGIEVELDKIKYVDYSKEDASDKEAEFYTYWSSQLVHLEKIADEMARLGITSINDVSLDLLDNKENINSLSNIFAETFSSDLLKNGVETLINGEMKKILEEYDVNLNDNAIYNVNNLVNTRPYYIIVDNKQLEIACIGNKYFIGEEEVIIENNRVNYLSEEYQVKGNSLNRIWNKELTTLSMIIDTIKTGDFTEKDNLTVMLNSIDEMALLTDVKNDLLLYAVKEANILEDEYYNNIDRENVDFTKEKNILLNVIDEYDMLKDMSDLNFSTIEDDEIETLSRILNNALSSDIFGDYAADTIVELANADDNMKLNLTSQEIKESNTWESDLKLIRKALNINNNFNEKSVTELLSGIKNSSLLGPRKEMLLIDAAKSIDIDGVEISDTLEPSDIDYDQESLAIIAAARNFDLLEDLSGAITLDSVNTSAISDLLASTINSKLFGKSVVDNLVLTLTDEGIYHDFDTIDSDNIHLVETIKSIDSKEKWENEFNTIKSLLEVDSRDEVTTTLFTTIEKESILLSACRANLLIKMVSAIEDNGSESLDLSDIDIETLTDNEYRQYDREKDLLIKLTNLTNIDDISDIETENKDKVAAALDAMELSVIFDKEYNKLLADITSPIENLEVDSENHEKLADWGISVDSTPDDVDWNNELNSLLLINDNMTSIASYDLDDAKANTEIIGKTLEAMDSSKIIGGSEAVAGKLLSKLVPGFPDTPIDRQGHSWKEVFDVALHM